MKYAIIGLGYIAERHLRAIKETGGEVVMAFDKHETGGILDRYFLGAKFPTHEIEFWNQLRESGAEYLVICTPNRHHFEHTQFGLERGMKIICEKPLTVEYKDALSLLRNENVYTILQLRLHPMAHELRNHVAELKRDGKKIYVEVVYNTPRGSWYHRTWKSVNTNGGILLNIGVHIFDLLIQTFGYPTNALARTTATESFAYMSCESADIKVNLSIGTNHLPQRTITVNGTTFDMTVGFDNLHTESYRAILNGNGFKVADALDAIRLVEEIR